MAYVFVIALAGLIVEAQDTIPFDNQSEPILEPVRTSRKWRGQSPHDHFNEGIFGYDTTLIKQKPWLHVGDNNNTNECCQGLQHVVRARERKPGAPYGREGSLIHMPNNPR